jgi:hypothetical protein
VPGSAQGGCRVPGSAQGGRPVPGFVQGVLPSGGDTGPGRRVRTMATAVRMNISMRAGAVSGAVVPCANAGRAVARRVVVLGAGDGTGSDVCAGDVTGGGTRS